MNNFNIDTLLTKQKALQEAYKTYPIKDDKMRNNVLCDHIFGLQSELFEALREFDWKKWSASSDMDVDRVKNELRDAFQFFLNCMLTIDMTPDELYTMTLDKQKVNWQRLNNNYITKLAHDNDKDE